MFIQNIHYLLVAVCVCLLLFQQLFWKRSDEEFKEIRMSIWTACFNIVVSFFFWKLAHQSYSFFQNNLIMKSYFLSDINPYLRALVYFLIADFIFFSNHLLAHKITLLWRFHAFHHSVKFVNFQSNFRHSPHYFFITLFWTMGISIVFNLDLYLVYLSLAIVSLYQVLVHNKEVFWHRWIGYFLVTPQYHRVHHMVAGSNYNLGGVLTIWDILTKRFKYDRDFLKQNAVYGLEGNNNFSQFESVVNPRP